MSRILSIFNLSRFEILISELMLRSHDCVWALPDTAVCLLHPKCAPTIVKNILVMFALLTAVSALGADTVPVARIRHPGMMLDTSLQNEVSRAVNQGITWLVTQQQPDGAWDTTNRVRSTSLVLCALHVSGQAPTQSQACTLAAYWLNTSATNRIVNLESHAWRLLALSLSLPPTPARTPLLEKFVALADATTGKASEETQRFWHEVLAETGVTSSPTNPPTARCHRCLTQLAATWPPTPYPAAMRLWHLARLINRTGAGQLARARTPLDWRTDLARHLISTQRRIPDAGGCWVSADSTNTVAETAFSILALMEL